MQVKLKVLSGSNSGQVIAVTVQEFLIGRGPECQLRPKSESVSGKHCRIAVGEGKVTVADLGSGSGTFLNGERIDGERRLKSADRLKVGPLEFEVEFEYELGGKRREKVKDVRDVAARVAQKKPDRDLDIDDWLKEEDEEEQANKGKSRRFNLDEIKIASSEEAEEKSDEETEENDKNAADSTKKKVRIVYDKLPPPPPKQEAKDTRDAAADMIRKLMGRKE